MNINDINTASTGLNLKLSAFCDTLKKIIALLVLFSVSAADAGLWTSYVNKDKTRETKRYKLDVKGFDVRVYEWTPSDNDSVKCVFVSGNQNSTGVACYEVK